MVPPSRATNRSLQCLHQPSGTLRSVSTVALPFPDYFDYRQSSDEESSLFMGTTEDWTAYGRKHPWQNSN